MVLYGPIYDIAIIGGGINGAAIARDAAGRGLSVFLCEQGDLGSATSSASTKLIHGGLRYLERYAFRLVREGLAEREVLLAAAPHVIRPIRFVLPHHRGLRPRWVLQLGLFIYDHLGGRKLLPPSRTLDLAGDPAGAPLRPEYRPGFEYSDCTVDDSRFVVLTAMDARTHGAAIHPRTRCVIAERERDLWRLSLESEETGATSVVSARTLVNAAGPWVSDVLDHVVHGHAHAHVRLVKGSHVIVRRLFDHDRAYVFQNGDRRIVFAIPYREDFTLIGTTDEDYHGDPADVEADDAEVAYLLAAVSDYLRRPVTEDMVVWTYSGVRPLYDDGASRAQEATRDYVLDIETGAGQAPILSVFGGKITTSRRLAEHALEKLAPYLKVGKPWTAGASLPGGNFPVDGGVDVVRALRAAYPFVAEAHARRLVSAYGTRAPLFLSGHRSMADLGHVFGADLTEAEVAWLMQEEWARTPEDVLWRRTKLGLRFTAPQIADLDDWMAEARQHVALPVA
jgi:glycerol-3-phosphate dehydrogenase